MKILLVTRGIPGSGKSTWIEEHDLEQYTLSADNIRLLYASPEQTIDGRCVISAKCDKHVWAFLRERLEARMKNGEFTVVDATHTKESYLKDYKKLCKEYNYRLVVVDFSSVDLDTIKLRNYRREAYKRVPEEVIDRMYNQIKVPLQGNYEIYDYNEFPNLDNFVYKIDGNKWKEVVIFGDIHNCYDPIRKYFEASPESDQKLYIFVGDYFDRGIQGKEVLQFCLDHCEKENFVFLQGNHEIWAKNYVRDGEAAKMTPDFKDSLVQFGELKDQLGKFARRLKVAVKVIFGKDFDHHFFTITHGGLSRHLSIETPAIQCIKGVGNYEDLDQVEESFAKRNESGTVQSIGHHYYNVHGHRNIKDNPIISSDGYNINLEGKVEFGGNLRIVELSYTDKMNILPIEISNTIYNKDIQTPSGKHDNPIIQQLDSSTLIHKKDLGDGIVSYNFSREAFFSQKWNKLTTTARGLFVDTKTNQVVARSYPKFFEAEQHPSTQWRNLEKTLVFPVTAYLKENGFLGIVSVYNDQLFIASKSTNQGEYKENFERILRKTIDCDKLKEYLKANNCSAIFECVDPINDPHIIEYTKEKVVLLDIVQNDFTDTFKSYDEVFNLAKEIGCKPKEMCKVFNTFAELKSFIEAFDKDFHEEIEGFVFVDQNNFMIKYKTPFYKFWKDMRRMKEYIMKGSADKHFAAKNVNSEQTELMNSLFRFMTELKNKSIDLDTLSIIDIRNKYLQENL
jgi:predicted kinase